MQLEQEAKDRPHRTSCTTDCSSKNGLYLQWDRLEGSELERATVPLVALQRVSQKGQE